MVRGAASAGGTGTTARKALTGLRVLVVEDSFLLADEIAKQLQAAGAEVLGPCAGAERALGLIEAAGAGPLAGVLDVQLSDGTAYGVAARLRELGATILFTTGYDRCALEPPWDGYPVCLKPVKAAAVVALLTEAPAAL